MSPLRPCPFALLLLACSTLAADPPASQPTAGDWPLWGGYAHRNAVSPATNVPADFDLEAGRNVRWRAKLGSYSYAGPILAAGRVYVGTNNAAENRPHSTGDKGCLLCFDAATGKLLWQATHDKLAAGDAQDWAEQGVASAPCIVGDRVYYVSNRCELVCADALGFHDDENDGPLTSEKFKDQEDADFVWILDMIKGLGVYPHNLAACNPVVAGDLVFVCTANGVDDEHAKPPAPQAPSFIAVNRHTGQVVWQRNDPGENILHGQWSSPAYGLVAGKPQAVFGGGDGWCYAFEPTTGEPLWKFDLNPKDSVWKPGGSGTKTSIVATPVIHDDKVFLAVGDDPEATLGPGGHLYAIDATKRGDVTETARLWQVGLKDFGRSLSSVVVADGLLYVADLNGFLYCFEAATGALHWKHDLEAGVWSSPTIIDGKVWIGTTDGELFVLRHGKEAEELARLDLLHGIYTAPAATDGTLYVVAKRFLYALGAPPPTTAPTAGADWPMFRGNSQQTGVATSMLPAKLDVCWRYELGDGTSATAAIVGDTVYAAGDSGKLLALDLATGGLKWSHASEDPILSSPTAIDGLVIYGDEAGVLRALDAQTGKPRWQFAAQDRIVSSANPAGDRLVFGSYDGHLYCLRIADGTLLWKYAGVHERIHGTPAIAADHVLAAGCDGKLHVVRLADGQAARTIELGSVTGVCPAVAGERVYVGCYGEQVLALDWQAGEVLWRFKDEERGFPFLSSAALVGDHVIVGGQDKRLRALNAATGRQKWEFVTRGRVDSSPVIVGERVFVGSADGHLYAVALETGKEVWRFETGGGIYASPAVGGEHLVIGTDDGMLYCFGGAGP